MDSYQDAFGYGRLPIKRPRALWPTWAVSLESFARSYAPSDPPLYWANGSNLPHDSPPHEPPTENAPAEPGSAASSRFGSPRSGNAGSCRGTGYGHGGGGRALQLDAYIDEIESKESKIVEDDAEVGCWCMPKCCCSCC